MIRVTKTFTRPNTSVNWWFSTPAGQSYAVYRMTTYGSKVSNEVKTISSDGLTWTYSVTWNSREEYDQMMADGNIQQAIAQRRAYDSQNGITEFDTEIVDL